ncbi:DNA adenine methylase [Corynebacterium macclintockiae]
MSGLLCEISAYVEEEECNQMAYRYLGNKSRLSEWIVNQIARHLPEGGLVADPMCGTAAVSQELALRGYDVLAGDALVFPTLHAKARLLHRHEPEFQSFGGYSEVIAKLNALPGETGYFYREFGDKGTPLERDKPRLYFTAENAGRIDAMRSFIRQAATDGCISGLEHDLLLHDLIMAVNQVANIAGTYGYFRSKISSNAARPIEIQPSSFSFNRGAHVVIHGDASTVLAEHQVDAIYLDPPYTKRQYAGNYHILETIAREDEPIARGDGGLRPWTEDASDFCYKRRAESAFREVIEAANARYIFVSYSEDGQLSPTTLLSILSDYGEVLVNTQDHLRFSSNSNAKTGTLTEFLYCVEVK